MDVLLLAGYRVDCAQTQIELLDEQIIKLKSLGLTPTVVLSGPFADEVLRNSKPLRDCELVYDTNDQPTLMTNLKSGIHVTTHTCFALPLEIPCPPKEHWVALKLAFQRAGFTIKSSFLQLTDAQGAPCHWGFPLFVTRLGRHLLLNEENLTSLTDPRLHVLYSTKEASEALAPETSSL